MNLFFDENLSSQHAVLLREQGYDAVSVAEAGLSGQPDRLVRDFTIASGRVLVTLDSAFGNIFRFPPAETPDVIRLKIHPPTEIAGIKASP